MAHRLTTCPNCGGDHLDAFYAVSGVPAHSMLLLHDRQEAQAFPTGDVTLAICGDCHFIANVDYDPALESYDAEYEASQAFSATFNAFHKALASDLIERYGLRGKEVVEIGCGQGEFLRLLCDLGAGRGLGFDPGFANAHADADGERVRVVADYYGEAHAGHGGDFVCCKQTLEHIPDTHDFVAMVRRAIGERAGVPVFFQVPDFGRIMDEGAFWDVYYEHCSYFTRPSLIRVFRRAGFDVLACRVEYDGQYLMVEATPGDGRVAPGVLGGDDVAGQARRFAESCQRQIAQWRDFLAEARRAGRRVALWGGGSKAVAFLTTLGAGDEVAFAVDINTRKQGCFLPSTGHEVVAPERLRAEPADVVIAMNPIYLREIQADLDRLGVAAELLSVNHFTAAEEAAPSAKAAAAEARA